MPQYYLSDGNTRRGPFPVEQLAAQGLTPDSLVWCEGMADWQPAQAVAELRPLLVAAQPAPAQPQYPQQPQYLQQPQYPAAVRPEPLGYQTPMGAPEGAGLGITAMVLGILSLLLFWAWFIGVPLAILAIIFGAIGAKKRAGKGMAIAGLVCGCVAIALLVIIVIIVGAFMASL